LPHIEDIELPRSIIDAGADLIIGHHSHCIQPYEIYRGKSIVYGLGNCIFPDFGAFAGGDGGSTEAWKKQPWWNRQSLAVTWETDSCEMSCSGLAFAGATLKPTRSHARPLAVEIAGNSRQRYRKAFDRHVRRMMLRLVCSCFLSKPKMPRLHQLKILLNNCS
jgi:hypothetical protein